MNNSKTNTLRLKLYDNVNRIFKIESNTKETIKNTHPSIREKNFMEFYIDGKSLINEIGKKYWNKENSELFFNHHIGYLGFFNEETDLIFISLMLVFESKEKTKEFIKNYSFLEISDQKIESLYEEIIEEKEEFILLYGCTCGDTRCGGIGVKIIQDENYYYWIFDGNEPFYRFDKSEYENELKNFLKKKKWH